MVPPGEAAVRALHGRRRSGPALAGSDRGVQRHQGGGGQRANSRRRSSTTSVERVLRAKASVGLHRDARGRSRRACRQASAAARTRRSRRRRSRASITLVQGRAQPGAARRAARRAGAVPVDARLSVRLADRGAEPHVHSGAEEALAAGHGDRAVGSHADVGARSGARHGAALRRHRRVGVRALRRRAAGGWISPAELVRLLRDLARHTEQSEHAVRHRRSSAIPYTASFLPELPAMLLTYDFYDRAERAAVRAIAGEAPISGRLPITLSPQLPAGRAGSAVGTRRRRQPSASTPTMLRDKLLRARSPRWATRPTISGSPRTCSASAARRPSSRAGSSRRRSSSRIGGRRGAAPASASAATRRPTPGVYVLKDAAGRALYVGKAINLRRRLRAHFAERRWRALEAGDVARRRRRVAGGRLGARGAAARGGADRRAAAAGERADRRARARHARACRARSCATSSSCVPSIEADSVELSARAVDGALDDPAHAAQRRRSRRPRAAR